MIDVFELLRIAVRLCGDRIALRARLGVDGFDSNYQTFPPDASGRWEFEGVTFELVPATANRSRLLVRCPACYRYYTIGKFPTHAQTHEGWQ